jgi:hypothetical protein
MTAIVIMEPAAQQPVRLISDDRIGDDRMTAIVMMEPAAEQPVRPTARKEPAGPPAGCGGKEAETRFAKGDLTLEGVGGRSGEGGS